MRILLTSAGSRGDIQPMVALAQALRAAGDEVRVAAAPNYRPLVEGAGFDFLPMGRDVQAWLTEQNAKAGRNPLKGTRALAELLQQETREQFALLEPLMGQLDCVVSAGGIMATTSLAEAAGLPALFVAFTPQLMRSGEHPPILFPWQGLPRALNHVLWGATRLAYDKMMLAEVNQHRRRLGLAPARDFLSQLVPRDVLLTTDPVLAPAPTDTSHRITQSGFLTMEDPTPLPEALERFLDAGEPPLYIGFGSMPDPNPEATTRMLLEVVAQVGCRLVLSRGWAGLGAGELPEGCIAVGSVPHEKLLPRVKAVVHHGGAGTVGAAARAGLPQLLVPHIADQFFWSHRVARAGLGPDAIPRPKLTRERLLPALRALLSEASFARRAQELAGQLRSRTPSRTAVDWVHQARFEGTRPTASSSAA